VERYVLHDAEPAAAPDILNVEVLHTLRRLARRWEIETHRLDEAVEDLSVLRIMRYPTLHLIHRAWELRPNFTAYDAVYVALAEALGTSLVTADQHLAKAARTHTSIEVVALG